jgi:hypothetical protein
LVPIIGCSGLHGDSPPARKSRSVGWNPGHAPRRLPAAEASSMILVWAAQWRLIQAKQIPGPAGTRPRAPRAGRHPAGRRALSPRRSGRRGTVRHVSQTQASRVRGRCSVGRSSKQAGRSCDRADDQDPLVAIQAIIVERSGGGNSGRDHQSLVCRRSRSRTTPAVDDARRIKIQDHHLAMILINRGGCTRGPAEEKRRLAATSSSCLALLVI